MYCVLHTAPCQFKHCLQVKTCQSSAVRHSVATKGIYREYYKPPHVKVPTTFRHFCLICVSGNGVQECPICEGDGVVLTEVGGAGVSGEIGLARCWKCTGMGKTACPLCAGATQMSRPVRDPRLDFED